METAMERVAERFDFTVRWQPFLLRPGIPKEGVQKPDATPENPRVNPRLKAAGAQVGIDFTGKADRYPNTVAAHALLEYTKNDPLKQNQLAEALFQAYFTDGFVLDDPCLLQLAEKQGLNMDEVKAVLKDEKKREEIQNTASGYSMQGVSGVPYFYMNGQKTFSGAQEPENFIKMFEIISEKFPYKEEQSGKG